MSLFKRHAVLGVLAQRGGVMEQGMEWSNLLYIVY